MEFLAETDEAFAQAKTDLLHSEILGKRCRSRLFVSGQGSVEARKAAAEGHQDTLLADDALVAATLAFEALKARRGRAEIVISVWQSLERTKR